MSAPNPFDYNGTGGNFTFNPAGGAEAAIITGSGNNTFDFINNTANTLQDNSSAANTIQIAGSNTSVTINGSEAAHDNIQISGSGSAVYLGVTGATVTVA